MIELYPDDRTVLMGSAASLSPGLAAHRPEAHVHRFWVDGWRSREQQFTWGVKVPIAGAYLVSLLIRNGGDPVIVEVEGGRARLTHTIPPCRWDRVSPAEPLRLPAGATTITLRVVEPGDGTIDLELFSLELTPPDVRYAQRVAASALRSPTSWMPDARYGLFFHWNSRSQPRSGPAKSYADAVRDFDVAAFAEMVHETGAGLVVFTTSWAGYHFPGPIRVIDALLPGRTTSRDLVRELATALRERGIRLMLYYHMGKDDTPWWEKQGLDDGRPEILFENWRRIVGEISERYGDTIAGLWFDDGTLGYYPHRAPWEQMTRAAKSGNRDLVVGYNPWILPKATDFQDFYTGEVGLTLEGAGVGNPHLPIGGDGRYTGGPQEGLQATFCGQLEGGHWTNTTPDTAIGPPLHTVDHLVAVIEAAMARHNVPILNALIYQDGTIAPATREVLAEVAARLKAPGLADGSRLK